MTRRAARDGTRPADGVGVPLERAGTESALIAVARDQDLVGLIGLVQSIGRDVHRRIGGRIELDDLVGEGYLALVRSRDRYDPVVGASFATFAYRRIEGAMLDLARRRRWFNEFQFLAGGYTDSMRELLDATHADSEWDGRGAESDARFAARAVGRTAVAGMMGRSLAGEASESIESAESRSMLLDALGRLSEEDKLVLRRIWIEGRSLSEVGAELDVSKEYARRLNIRALDRIRRIMMVAPVASCPVGPDRAPCASGGTIAEKGSTRGNA